MFQLLARGSSPKHQQTDTVRTKTKGLPLLLSNIFRGSPEIKRILFQYRRTARLIQSDFMFPSRLLQTHKERLQTLETYWTSPAVKTCLEWDSANKTLWNVLNTVTHRVFRQRASHPFRLTSKGQDLKLSRPMRWWETPGFRYFRHPRFAETLLIVYH